MSEKATWVTNFPPVTLASIAGTLRARGHEVKLLDCIGADIPFRVMLDEVVNFKPDITVVNTSTPTIMNDLNVVKSIKSLTNCLTVVYGVHPTVMYQETLEACPSLDFCVRGDPETPILKIAEGHYSAPGVCTRGRFSDVYLEDNLDRFPFAAHDLLPPYVFPLTGNRWTLIIDGRGCPFDCTFCVEPYISGRKARYRSVGRIVSEIEWVRELGISEFLFWDELFTLNRERVISLCNAFVEKGLHKKIKWICTTRVDRVDAPLLKRMKEAGCWMISFGLESGDQSILDRCKKGITLEQSKSAIKMAKEVGLVTIGHFIIGLPMETEETIRRTIDFAKSSGLDFAQFYMATPFPGSDFYEEAKANGWLIARSWEEIEQGSCAINYPHLPKEKIEAWRRKAYHEFYFRPRFFYRFLKSLTVKALVTVPSKGVEFLKWMRK
jgi:radical SAM superfamily enzyme YgiQ (UPF0313 family)